MNCKPGDLAVIVRGTPENNGIFVRVLVCDTRDSTWTFEEASRPVQMYMWQDKGGAFSSTREAGGNAWLCDDQLLPIRDQPGEDEMLRIAGKPQDQREPA